MDVDRFIAVNRPAWDRLAWLSARGGRKARSLTPDQLDELVHLYQRVAGHLSHARARYQDAALTASLTKVVADANAAIYGGRTNPRAALSRFVFVSFPGAMWRIRWFVAAAAVLTFLPTVLLAAWMANSDAALDASAPAEVRQAYIDTEFEDYYSSQPAAQFAALVTFNNIQVAFFAFAAGIVVCLGTAFILASNGANLGFAAGLFYAVGEQGRFWGLILPHGLLELTAVVFAGAAGLRLGWTVIDPGDRPRTEALADEGRRAMTVVLGLIAAFVVAGLIEGFITGSGLPTVLRVGVGVAVEVAFLVHIWRFGRVAAADEEALAASVDLRAAPTP